MQPKRGKRSSVREQGDVNDPVDAIFLNGRNVHSAVPATPWINGLSNGERQQNMTAEDFFRRQRHPTALRKKKVGILAQIYFIILMVLIQAWKGERQKNIRSEIPDVGMFSPTQNTPMFFSPQTPSFYPAPSLLQQSVPQQPPTSSCIPAISVLNNDKVILKYATDTMELEHDGDMMALQMQYENRLLRERCQRAEHALESIQSERDRESLQLNLKRKREEHEVKMREFREYCSS